jgi:NADPH-dependent 2,4-dienoyl-CoA reductase/sulfur reductase-like enzyme
VAAERGHDVSLYEQKDHLGGQLALAARIPHKEGFLDAIRHMELMAERIGVRIHLGARVTAEELLDEEPDVVILATGGLPLSVAFPGLESTRWALASEVLEEEVDVETPSVLVVGGGLVGLETAEFLGAQGKKVTLVEKMGDVGGGLDVLPRAMLLKRLREHGVEIHTHTEVRSLKPEAARARKEGDGIELPLETLVLAVGVRPDRTLSEALAGSGLEMHVIGDAEEPRGVGEAIREGFEAGAAL